MTDSEITQACARFMGWREGGDIPLPIEWPPLTNPAAAFALFIRASELDLYPQLARRKDGWAVRLPYAVRYTEVCDTDLCRAIATACAAAQVEKEERGNEHSHV